MGRWRELTAFNAQMRVGHLLHYPRGQNRDQISLVARNSALDPVTNEWSVSDLPRSCIDSIELANDEKARKLRTLLARLQANPEDQSAMTQLARYGGKEALRISLDLYRGNTMPRPLAGALLTKIGALAGSIGDRQPELHMRAVDTLTCVARHALPSGTEHKERIDNCNVIAPAEPVLPRELAETAMTALHVVGGPYAANRFKQLIEADSATANQQKTKAATPPRRLAEAGTSITAAGFLASDVRQVAIELGVDESRQASEEQGIKPGVDGSSKPSKPGKLLNRMRFTDFLVQTIDSERPSSASDAATACTALGLAGAPDTIEKYIQNALDKPTPRYDRINACLLNLPVALSVDFSPRLIALIEGSGIHAKAPTRTRQAALQALYRTGLYDQSKLLFDLFSDPLTPPELRQRVIAHFDDADGAEMGNRLLECARREANVAAGAQIIDEPGTSPADTHARRRCLFGLLLLNDSEKGDSGLFDRMLAWAESSDIGDLKAPVCTVMNEFADRNGYAARIHFNKVDDPEKRSNDQPVIGPCQRFTNSESTAKRIAMNRTILQQATELGIDPFVAKDPSLASTSTSTSTNVDETRKQYRDAVSAGERERQIETGLRLMLDDDRTARQPLRDNATGNGDFKTANAASRAEATRMLAVMSMPTAAEADTLRKVFVNGGNNPEVEVAAQYLEDLPSAETAKELLTCRTSTELGADRHDRCTRGLALLASDDDGRGWLATIADDAVRNPAWCNVVAELAARDNPSAVDLLDQHCKASPPPWKPGATSRERWLSTVMQINEELLQAAQREAEDAAERQQRIDALQAALAASRAALK